jgi:tetratricopeptide (TPR) repeat protein
VHYRLVRVVLGIAAVTAVPTLIWANPTPQAAQESPYKDQGEYDLATAAGKETDPQKKLDKLKEWEQKYPESKLAATRTLYMAQALLGISNAGYGQTDIFKVDASLKAGQQIVDNLDKYFSAANKPPTGVTDEQWAGAKHTFELQAHSALAWDYMTKKDDANAETQFKKVLSLDPNQAQMSYWLGSVIIRQKNVARYSEAIYDIARAVSITGPGALPDASKKAAEDYLKRVYAGYHGDETGLDQVKDQVKASALPPPDYHIKSVEDIQKEQFANEADFNKAHPDIALFRTIKAALTAPTGAGYFDQVKGSEVPPPDVGMFKAKIVSVADKAIVANVDNAGGDVTLKFEKALNQKVLNVGDPFEFKGVVESFTPDPYMLTLTIDDPKESIKGLPDNAFSAAPPVKKKPVPKKKQ